MATETKRKRGATGPDGIPLMRPGTVGAELPSPPKRMFREWFPGRDSPPSLVRIYMSREYSVQEYAVPGRSVRRLSIRRHDSREIRVSWSVIQWSVRQTAGDVHAIEHYPRDIDVVNDAPMRHVFILPETFDLDAIGVWR